MTARPHPAIPARVAVGPYAYAVRYATPLLSAEHVRRLGECDHLAATIALDPTPAPCVVFETFVHELLHAADHVAGAAMTEEQVARLAMVLAAVLVDNGWVALPRSDGEGAA